MSIVASRAKAFLSAGPSPWAGVSLLFFVPHVFLVRDAIQNGDGAVYNDQIEQGLLGVRTTHMGYLLCGFSANAVLPFGVERNMNLMCLAFAAAGAAAIFVIARALGAERHVALMAPALGFAAHAYLRGAVLAEVDVVACSLILVAVALWLQDQRIGAGLAFGVAMLVTPVCALSLPLVVLTPRPSRQGAGRWLNHVRDVLLFGAVSLTVYVPVVAVVWRDYFYGGRGILHAPREPWNLVRQVAHSFDFLIASASPWVLVGIAAAIAGLFGGAPLSLGVCSALVLVGAFGERTQDVPVQLPQLCVLAALVVVVVGRLPARALRWSVLVVVWLLVALPSYSSVARELRADCENRDMYRAMAAETPRMMLVGGQDSWNDGLRFERVVYKRTKLGLNPTFPELRYAMASVVSSRRDYAIWLLDVPPPGLMDPFARGWTREVRTVRGRPYEVWLPNETVSR